MKHTDELLDEALKESFPASDPAAVTVEPTLSDNEELHRYEMSLDGVTAHLRYKRMPGVIELVHTQVPDALQGRGIGSALVKAVLDRVRADGLRVVPTCPFVRRVIETHPEYADMIEESR
jgi:predicted GNAT family acetyltransferase